MRSKGAGERKVAKLLIFLPHQSLSGCGTTLAQVLSDQSYTKVGEWSPNLDKKTLISLFYGGAMRNKLLLALVVASSPLQSLSSRKLR